ncbi:CaiB/BaiF CoA transferase family protein [Aquicoccus sp.]|uniref:CaiB/BaiF CoA transferase family protein n=1 Tax=Aquicoccus sp. TaxID=2055851 RepID=UPI00356B4FA4
MTDRRGPLTGLNIIEMTGIGPVPYASMLLADLGARVIRIDRPGGYPAPDPTLDFAQMGAASIFYRSRRMVKVDLKSALGRNLILRLIGRADALIEGYRPGTMERLALGPSEAHAANPRLSYVRVTGWGQDGPMAQMAGHDLNYIGLSGALSLFGRDSAPPRGLPPLVGDMAGGALFAVIGTLASIHAAKSTGQGQVVDSNIVDGSASLYSLLTALSAVGLHGPAGTNALDGGRHYYRTYACSDGGYVAVGAIEPAFRWILLDRLGLADDPCFSGTTTDDEAHCTKTLEDLFRTAPRAYWERLFHDTDGCVTGILGPDDAAADPRNTTRDVFTQIDGVRQAGPAPRFSETPGAISISPRDASPSAPEALTEWGLDLAEIEALIASSIVDS